MLWCSKYAPKSISDVAGNSDALCRLKKWALEFSIGKPQKPLLIYGPVGCAKSAAVHAISSELDFETVSISPPQKNDVVKWEKRLSEVLGGSSLFGASSIVVCEDIDKWHLSKLRGLIGKLTVLVKNAKVPVILTAQDAYDRRLSAIRPYCERLELKAINHADILNVLAKISDEQKSLISKEQIQQIALNCSGDLRAAINDLQAQNFEANRESEKKQFEILRSIFRSPNYASTRGVDLGPLADRSTLKLYVSENIPSELHNQNDMICAFNFLSRADVFDGRIMRRQYWGYLRYSSTLMFWGISSCRRHIKAGFTPYAFPSYIRKMGATRSKRAIYKNAAKKIAPMCHCTTRHAQSFIPLISEQMDSIEPRELVAKKLCDYYDFEQDELASICGVSQNNLYTKKKTSSRPKKPKLKKP